MTSTLYGIVSWNAAECWFAFCYIDYVVETEQQKQSELANFRIRGLLWVLH